MNSFLFRYQRVLDDLCMTFFSESMRVANESERKIQSAALFREMVDSRSTMFTSLFPTQPFQEFRDHFLPDIKHSSTLLVLIPPSIINPIRTLSFLNRQLDKLIQSHLQFFNRFFCRNSFVSIFDVLRGRGFLSTSSGFR